MFKIDFLPKGVLGGVLVQHINLRASRPHSPLHSPPIAIPKTEEFHY